MLNGSKEREREREGKPNPGSRRRKGERKLRLSEAVPVYAEQNQVRFGTLNRTQKKKKM